MYFFDGSVGFVVDWVQQSSRSSACNVVVVKLRVEILFNWFNPYIPNVQKVVKRTLNILPQMLQDFERMFEHFVHTKHYKG